MNAFCDVVRWRIANYGQNSSSFSLVNMRACAISLFSSSTSWEGCNPEDAEIPFDNILDRVTGSDPSVTDYVLDEAAKCPNYLMSIAAPCYRATANAAAFQDGFSDASSRSRTRRRSWPAAVSPQNHRAKSSPCISGFIARRAS